MKKTLIFITAILIMSFSLSVPAGSQKGSASQDKAEALQAPVVTNAANRASDELEISPNSFPRFRNDGDTGGIGFSGENSGANRSAGPGDHPCTGPVCPYITYINCQMGSCTATCNYIAYAFCNTSGIARCACANNITSNYISNIGAFFSNNPIMFEGRMAPETLNLKRQGRFYTFYIEDPSNSIDLSTIDISSVMLYNTLNVIGPSGIGDEDGDGIPDLMVKFDADEVDLEANIRADGLTLPLMLSFFVNGFFNDGSAFFAIGDTRVICPGNCE